LASGAIYRRALAGPAVKCRVFRRVPPTLKLNSDLLQRRGDWTICDSIGFGVRELLLVRVQEGGNFAFSVFPAEFPIERGD
jgi:hypothetical protein